MTWRPLWRRLHVAVAAPRCWSRGMAPRTRRVTFQDLSPAGAARSQSPQRHGAAPATPAPPSPPRVSPAKPRQVKLHRFAKAHKYDASGCPIYTRNEVIADTVVHFVGVPFGIYGSYLILSTAYARLPAGTQQLSDGDRRHIFGLWVYCFGLCAMLCASAAYNVIGCGLKIATQQLRRVDHGCIYLMIAGCYTPFMLGLPEGIISPLFDNDSALIALWVVAVLAALAKVIFARKFETAGLVMYVALGCIAMSFSHAVHDGYRGGSDLMWELKKSGGCYLFGLIFYLDDDVPFSNALWHTCVLAGAVSHWLIIYRMMALGDSSYPL